MCTGNQLMQNLDLSLERGVIHSLISRAKDICQDRKEIQNIKHYLIFNEHPQELISL
jgi:hypothetical protein